MPRRRYQGESSSQQPQVEIVECLKVPLIGRDNFVSDAALLWYNNRYNNQMLVEKLVDPQLNDELEISQRFQALGWSSVLHIKGNYYPDMVKVFYANMPKVKPFADFTIHSAVQGRAVSISEEDINTFLQLHPRGYRLNLDQGITISDVTWTRETVVDNFDIPTACDSRGFPVIKVKYMDIKARMLIYMIQHNVIPRASSINTARIADLILLIKWYMV